MKARHPEMRFIDYVHLIHLWALIVGTVLLAGFVLTVFVLTAVSLYSYG